MVKLKSLVSSRKFWAAVIGLVLLVVKELDPNFPLDADQLTNVVYLVVAYILGTAFEDGLRAARL